MLEVNLQSDPYGDFQPYDLLLEKRLRVGHVE
jgi:hypothetical protein